MNGPDILLLQMQLKNCGFNEIGEIDGYYGPLAENVVKKIQYFLGFEKNGIVNKQFWNFIFSKANETILKNINIISKYNIKDMVKIIERRMGYSTEGGEIEKYFFDNEIKQIILHIAGETYQVHYYLYYISTNYYFIIEEYYRYPFPIYYTWLERQKMSEEELERYADELAINENGEFWVRTVIEYKSFINENNNFYRIINGEILKTDFNLNEINEIINN